MVKKLVVLAVFFVALCFAGIGCYRGGAHIVVDDGLYYDGPYRFGGGLYYYYNGGFYVHEGGAYRFHHHAPQDQRGHYDERHRKHHGQYNREHPKSPNQHPGHPGHSPRQEEWRDWDIKQRNMEIYTEAESDMKILEVKRGESRIRPEDLRVLQLEISTEPVQEGQRVVFQVTISNGSRPFGELLKQFSNNQS